MTEFNPTTPLAKYDSQAIEGSTRDGFGKALVKAAQKNNQIVGLCADLTESTRMHWFRDQFPDRFVQLGVAEQNMMGVAAGLALTGKIPVAASYAVFSPGRNWDQLRVSVCYSNLNVKIIGGHAGLSVGPDGATHQALEDIAITQVLPNMTVLVPCDQHQAAQATAAMLSQAGPTYLRLSREKTPNVTTELTPFELGKGQLLRQGTDVSIVATGLMVYQALLAADQLKKDGISAQVINMHTIKPLDTKLLAQAAHHTGAVITAEEHQLTGGLGSTVASALSQTNPVPMEMVGVEDTFGESGSADELFAKYKLTDHDIIAAVQKVLVRKRRTT